MRLIGVIFDRLHMNEVHFLILMTSLFFFCFLFDYKYVIIIMYVLQLLWTPYNTLEIRPLINDVEVSMIVRAKVSLICFAIVE